MWIYGTLSVVRVAIVPDYNRDMVIDSEDTDRYWDGVELKFWVNDDNDRLECTDDQNDNIQDSEENNSCDNVINGKSDLLDFTPLWIDIHDLLVAIEENNLDASVWLSQPNGSVNICYTDLSSEEAGTFHISDSAKGGIGLNKTISSADIVECFSEAIPTSFRNLIKENKKKGVVMPGLSQVYLGLRHCVNQ